MLYLLGINRYDPKHTAPSVIDALIASEIIFGEHKPAAEAFLEQNGIDPSTKQIYEVNSQNEDEYVRWSVEQLYENKNISFITGDGYPIITDPGFKILNAAILHKQPISVLPQVSAIVSSVIHSGYLGAGNQTFFYGGMIDFMTDQMYLEAEKSKDIIGVYLFQGTYEKLYKLCKIYGNDRDVAVCVDMGHPTQNIIFTTIGNAKHYLGGTYATLVVSPLSKYNFFNINKMPSNISELRVEQNTKYVHNTYNFRSDEFTKDHSNKAHILFSGCSITWGQGLDEENIWAHRTFKAIEKDYNVSGYFNLGMPGSSISEVCDNVMLYIKNIGKPDVIFLNLPDWRREFRPVGVRDDGHEQDAEKYKHANIAFNKLVGFCNISNIKVIAFSWVEHLDFNNEKRLAKKKQRLIDGKYSDSIDISNKSFNHADIPTFKKNVLSYLENNPNDPQADVAKDGDHSGNALHWGWYNYAYDLFKKDEGIAKALAKYKKIQKDD